MAQCVKAPTAQPNNQSSAPGTHGRRELTQASCPLTSGTHAHKIKELKKESLPVLPSSKKLMEAFNFFFFSNSSNSSFLKFKRFDIFKICFYVCP